MINDLSYWLLLNRPFFGVSEFSSANSSLGEVVSDSDICRAIGHPAYLHGKFRSKNNFY